MFENQPKGLWTLALANTGERFGYYTMLAAGPYGCNRLPQYPFQRSGPELL